MLADLARNVLTDVDEADGSDVNSDKLANAQVHKIQGKMASIVREIGGHGAMRKAWKLPANEPKTTVISGRATPAAIAQIPLRIMNPML